VDRHVGSVAAYRGGAQDGGSVVTSSGDEVVVLWRQRGLSPSGEHFDGPVLALYTVQAGKLARAQVFYFNAPASGILAWAAGRVP
jgi:ketosteroid isomerase-like protein